MTGGAANGPWTRGVISGDRRYARIIAFESEAADIVPGGTSQCTRDGLGSTPTGDWRVRPILEPVARLASSAAVLVLGLAVATGAGDATGQNRTTSTTLLSRSLAGGTPNGASTNAVISGDRRYAQIVAFESEASDLVASDPNGHKDVFAIRRAGPFGNRGTPWTPGAVRLISRGVGGRPANGPSVDPAVDGSFDQRARCVAFLSNASNLVRGDTNGVADAFLAKAPKFTPRRVSLPRNRQSAAAATAVAVSGDCSRTAFVVSGSLYVRTGSGTRRLRTNGAAGDPSFAAGRTNDLVFGARKGVYLSSSASGKPRLVAKKGRNPAYNGIRRRVLAYERMRGGVVQIAFRTLGRGERIASAYRGNLGDRDSRDPVVVNTGFFIGFESDATNLPTKASGTGPDANGLPDAYLFTDTRQATVLESIDSSNDPFAAGGRRPSTSFYRNYVVFDSSANDPSAPPQVFMRYLGGI